MMKFPFFKIDKHLLIILLLSILLLFPNLGDRNITTDESFTGLVAKTIVDEGYPAASYNGVLINPKETSYLEIDSKEIYTWNSWLHYYVAASFMSVFGDNEFFLRFPFTLFAFFSVALFYFFVKELTKNNALAYMSALLMVLSTTFCLHARQLRWYGLVVFFGIFMMYSFWMFLKNKRRSTFYLILSSVLLFHTNFFMFFGLTFALLVYFVFFKIRTFNLKKIILPLFFVFILTFPWFYLTGQLIKTSGVTFNFYKLILNLFIISYYIFIFLIPLMFIFIFLFFLKYKRVRRVYLRENYCFVFVVILSLLFFFSFKSDVLPQIRYLVLLIPLFSLINSVVLYEVYKKKRIIAYILVVLLIFTNLLNLFPFVFMKNFDNPFDSDKVTSYEKERFIENTLEVRFLFFDYVYEISHDYVGPEKIIIDYVMDHRSVGDTFITNSLAFRNSFMFYTGMSRANLTKGKPDWILVRALTRENVVFNENMKKINLSDYEEILLKGFDDSLWSEGPDPVNHRFKTRDEGVIVIYHLKGE